MENMEYMEYKECYIWSNNVTTSPYSSDAPAMPIIATCQLRKKLLQSCILAFPKFHLNLYFWTITLITRFSNLVAEALSRTELIVN